MEFLHWPVSLSLAVVTLSFSLVGWQSAAPRTARSTAPVLTQPLITQDMRRDDARLDSRITLKRPRIAVGELLEEIGRQTGIGISAGERDGAADEVVAAFCKGEPASRIMNVLWSCMSYRGAEWEWRRTGEPGAYHYALLQPDRARRLRQRLRDWVQAKLEKNATTMINAADGTDAQKQSALKELYGDPGGPKYGPPLDQLWTDVRVVKEALTPAQRLSTLRASMAIEAPMIALDPQTRDYLLGRWREGRARAHSYSATGDELTMPEPDRVTVVRRNDGGSSTPSVFVFVSGVPAYAEFGGSALELPYKKMVRGLWKLDGDADDDAAARRQMKQPPDAALDPPEPTPPLPLDLSKPHSFATPRGDQPPPETVLSRMGRELEHIAEGAKVPVIARLPGEETLAYLTDPWGVSINDYFHKRRLMPIMTKWRDGVLIVSTESWPMEDPPVPLWLVRALRRDARPGKLLPFDDLTAAADLLTHSQLMHLKPEFPVMESVAGAQGILALLHRYPSLARRALTTPGVPLTPEIVEALHALPPSPLNQLLDSRKARYFALIIIVHDDPRQPSREVIFQLRAGDSRFLKGLGFTDRAQPPAPNPDGVVPGK